MDGRNGHEYRGHESLRQVTFRVEHDCPLAALSREVPQARFTDWNGHRIEVLDVRCTRAVWDQVVEIAPQHLEVRRTFATPEGGLVVAEFEVPAGKSLSRILEANQCMALQPMRVAGGWESYDAIAFGPGKDPEQAALAALARQWPTQVTRRRGIEPSDLAASLFQSLRPVLEAPTDKQAEALAAAARAGYYQSPRGATTAEVATAMGLGRSAFEERLRGAENRVLTAVAGAIEAHRLQD
jgi:predicted DNA binding protein